MLVIGFDANALCPRGYSTNVLLCPTELGEFQFNQATYYADPRTSSVALSVLGERKGCDGKVQVEDSTM